MAVMFDKSCGTVYKVGDYNLLKGYYNETQELYRNSGYDDIADDLVLMELPSNEEEIEKVISIAGYVKNLYYMKM